LGIRTLLPKTGRGSARTSPKASGPPVVDASGTIVVDVLGLPSVKEAGPRSPTSATAAALSLWPRLGRSGATSSSGASAIPTSGATGGSVGESATAPAGVDTGGLAPWQLVSPGPPLEGALRGGQPTGLVRHGTGCRGQPRLKGLPGSQTSRALPPLAERREDKIKTHGGKDQSRGILGYLPTPDQGQSCLRGGPSGLDPRMRCRG
jgi:hypothetical protein